VRFSFLKVAMDNRPARCNHAELVSALNDPHDLELRKECSLPPGLVERVIRLLGISHVSFAAVSVKPISSTSEGSPKSPIWHGCPKILSYIL
jgi:hypothetical protein